MNVIFVDIDGVLVTWQSIQESNNVSVVEMFALPRKMLFRNKFDTKCVEQLNRLTDVLDAKLVISSLWRVGRELSELQELFKEFGVKAEVIGATPYLATFRGHEIRAWLDNNKDKEIEWYCILDDSTDMCELLPCLYQSSMRLGLTEHIVDIIINAHSSV